MIDWHCHILPGLDDGPETMVESLSMARLLAETGFRIVHCTPHCIHGRFENTPEQVKLMTERLQQNLLAAGIPLLVKPGMEYSLDEYFPWNLENPQPLGDSRMLLVEAPARGCPELIRENVERVIESGYTPLFAHPERCELLNGTLRRNGGGAWKKLVRQLFGMHGHPHPVETSNFCDDLRHALMEMGCLFQGNIGSFAGWYGPEVRQEALNYLGSGFYSRLGSDGHGFRSLEMALSPGLSLLDGYPEGFALLRRPMPTGVHLKLSKYLSC
jgi:protein-tyrosine phosphatase